MQESLKLATQHKKPQRVDKPSARLLTNQERLFLSNMGAQ